MALVPELNRDQEPREGKCVHRDTPLSYCMVSQAGSSVLYAVRSHRVRQLGLPFPHIRCSPRGIKQRAPLLWKVRLLGCTEIMLQVLILALYSSVVFATTAPVNDGIHLAIGPNCGSLAGNFSDVNSGLHRPDFYDTIVSFGDSYSTSIRCLA